MNDKEYTYDIDKYTIGVDENGEDEIGLTIAIIKNGGINVLGNYYGEKARCIDLLIKENQELKKQLENKYEKVGTLTNEVLYEENTKLINQQKEFIEWLEKKIKRQEDYVVSFGLTIDYGIAEYTSGKIDALKESLSKYKEITGDDNK